MGDIELLFKIGIAFGGFLWLMLGGAFLLLGLGLIWALLVSVFSYLFSCIHKKIKKGKKGNGE